MGKKSVGSNPHTQKKKGNGKMTNEQIIFNESLKLMALGIIGSTGRKFVLTNEDGEKKEMLEPECIHTYAKWKALGRQVKKGEKCVASFIIWKHTTKKKETESEDEEKQTKMFMTKASFFRECQTEAITE